MDTQDKGLRISAGVFGHAAEFVSQEETRWYLNGVYIEPAKEGVVAVATDGHRLVAVFDKEGLIERPAIIRAQKGTLVRFRQKHDAIVKAETLGAKEKAQPITARLYPTKGAIENLLLDEIDGTFPDWRRVMPVDFPSNGVLPAFQGRYLAAFDALARVGGHTGGVRVIARGKDEPAVVTPACGSAWPWIGILMPIRGDAAPTAYPKWLGLNQRTVRIKAKADRRAA